MVYGEAASSADGSGERLARGSKHVCIIGAGAAGLISARVLREEGHEVVVFEQSFRAGGTWVLEKHADGHPTDPLAMGGVHSSMYPSLRTNLPRDLMATTDFTFEDAGLGGSPQFPGHKIVLDYLDAYLNRFNIGSCIEFGNRVQGVESIAPTGAGGGPRWRVRVASRGSNKDRVSVTERVREFDAVCVANGHYSLPRLAEVPNLEHFSGAQLHSHNYRDPGPFKGRHVILVGASASGEDLAREIAAVADRVVLSSRGGQGGSGLQAAFKNLVCRDALVQVDPYSGDLCFADGLRELCGSNSILMHCSGYHYSFPFLETANLITTEGGMVAPLFEHLFHVEEPSLSFVGIPYKVVPFPQFEVQARLVSRFLSGRCSLPDVKERRNVHAKWLASLREEGIATRHAHKLGEMQWDYNNRLARLGGFDGLEPWRMEGYRAAGASKRVNPLTYRDACAWRKPLENENVLVQ